MQKIEHLLMKGAHVSITALLFLLPFIFIPAAWATTPHAKMAIVALGMVIFAALWGVGHIIRGSVSIPRSYILISVLLLPLVYIISALLSGAALESFVGIGAPRDTVVAICLWAAVLIAVALTINSTRTALGAYRVVITSALIVLVFEFVRLFGGESILSLGGLITLPSASLLGSWHDLAIFFGVAAFLSLTYFGSAFADKKWKWISVLVVVLSLIFLVLMNMRDVWIALTVLSGLGLAYVVYMYTYRGRQQKEGVSVGTSFAVEQPSRPQEVEEKRGGIALLVPIAAVCAISIAFSFFGGAVYDRIPEGMRVAEVSVRPSWEGTFAVASAVYQNKSFLFGSGPNTFTRQWGLYKPSGVNETAFWNADFSQGIGFIPTSAVSAGLIGILAWILFLGTVLLRGIRSLVWAPPSDRDGRWKFVILGLFGGILYLWVLLITYPPSIALLTLTFLLTGVFVGAQGASGLIPSLSFDFRSSLKTGVIGIGAVTAGTLIVIVAGFLSMWAIAADMFINRAIVVFNTTGSVESAQAELLRAAAFSPKNARVYRAAAELSLIEFQNLLSSNEGTPEEQERMKLVLQQAIQHGLSVATVDTADYRGWLFLASVYEQFAGIQITGAYEEAKNAYERAITENPNNPQPYARLASLEYARGNMEAARGYIDQALARKQNYAEVLFLLSQIEAGAGNVQEATDAAGRAAAAAPQEPLVWFQLGVLYFGQNDYARAASALEQAVILNNNYANALYVLGLSYFEIGRTGDALVVFRRVLELNSGNEVVISIIENLEAGKSPSGEERVDATAADTEKINISE